MYIPWWYQGDEVFIFTEVVRQLRLDPNQGFFDIPGTPYITLTSTLATLWWGVERLIGLTRFASPADFAFANMPAIFLLMRTVTLTLYAGAVFLAFDLFRRSVGLLGGLCAAVLLASLPTHVQYSATTRTESLGLVLTLGAIWLVLYSRWRGTPAIYGWAGGLAGVAMAARFHFALVGFPIILALFLLRDRKNLGGERNPLDYRLTYRIGAALAAVFLAGGIVTLLFELKVIDANWLTQRMLLTTRAGPAEYAGAKANVAKLWLLLGSACGLVLGLHTFPRGRRWIWTVCNPYTILLSAGFAAGFLLAHPAFLWRGEMQLRSIQFYADWTDAGLLSMSPIRSWLFVSRYYFNVALPELWLRLAFVAGALLIILWRRRVPLAFLGGAMVCFVAQPIRMTLWPHHVIPWLPFICFTAAAPVGLLGEWITRRIRTPAQGAAAVLVSAMVLLGLLLPRVKHADDVVPFASTKVRWIEEANRWISQNVQREAYLLESYFTLNGDGFLKWIESNGVEVPKFVNRRHVNIWSLERLAADGHRGFAVVSPWDVEMFGPQNPASRYNPYKDAGFQPIAQFGEGRFGVQVFEFDFLKTHVRR
jgi:hypothetical protein